VIVGVVNHEFSSVNYSVKIVLVTVQYVYNVSTGRNDTIELANQTLDFRSAVLGHDSVWEWPFNFTISQPGDYKLRFLLYKDAYLLEPYRSLHLWIKVS